MKNRDDPNNILPMEGDLSERWLVQDTVSVFDSLGDKTLFDTLCGIAIAKDFSEKDLAVFRNAKNVMASREGTTILSVAECLVRLKTMNNDLFFWLLTRLCQKRFQAGRIPWVLSNGVYVYADRENRLVKWTALPFLPRALAVTVVPKDPEQRKFLAIQQDLSEYTGGPIGTFSCVETGPNDQIVYGYRMNERRTFPDRFVLNRDREPTNLIHFTIRLTVLNYYTLLGLGLGGFLRPVPHINNALYYLLDERGKQDCRDFWRRHAYVYNKKKVRGRMSRTVPDGWEE